MATALQPRPPHLPLDQLAVVRANVELGQVGRAGAVGVGDLHHDVILLALALEARHLPAAEQRLQRTADREDADAAVGDPLARMLLSGEVLDGSEVVVDVDPAGEGLSLSTAHDAMAS